MGQCQTVQPGAADVGRGEAGRLAAVRRYDILDTPPDGAFDRVAALAARVFDVPIATVTIVDENRVWFKATQGLDGVTQVDREEGLCASAVAQDDAYVVTDALRDPRTARNSLVTGKLGVRFYAAAPITTSDGWRLGTVNVIDTRPRDIGEDGIATLHDLAAIVMDELELRLSAMETVRRERHERDQAERDRADIEAFASTLQRTLVPPELPQVPGLAVATGYRVASPRQVGGDFYDLFALGERRWAVAIGDVCGKGASAAALTSLARYTLRAAASHGPSPVAVLERLNEALLANQDGEDRLRFVTVAFGLLEPLTHGGFRVEFATGGHPPPYLVRAGGGVEALRRPGGTLVGALADARFTTFTVDLGPGDAVVAYTDGLTEARSPDRTMFGDHALRSFLATRARLGAQELVDELTTRLEEFSPTVSDDMAILALAIPTDAQLGPDQDDWSSRWGCTEPGA